MVSLVWASKPDLEFWMDLEMACGVISKLVVR
jgi:hypothetical protein